MLWELNQENLKLAENKYGLERPVKYEVTNNLECAYGDAEHDVREIDLHHIIRIRPYLQIEFASSAIWHELTHARQLCRDYQYDSVRMLGDYYKQLEEAELITRVGEGGWNNMGVYQTSMMYLSNFKEWHRRYKTAVPLEREAYKMASCMAWRYPLVNKPAPKPVPRAAQDRS